MHSVPQLTHAAGWFSWKAPRLLPLVVFVLVVALAPRGAAHELDIDQVSLWPDEQSGGMRGQISLDPELTRSLPSALPSGEAQRRLVGFLEANLRLSVDGNVCTLAFEVRELYTKGGAVPGDIALLSCQQLPRSTLSVHVGEGFGTLAITVAGLGAPNARQSVLVSGGNHSPVYNVSAPERDSWQQGGHEQLLENRPPVSPAGAPTVVPVGPEPRPSAEPGFETPQTGRGFTDWLRLGFVHILPKGWDHVLFVTALTLGGWRRLGRLLLELSTFTLAHCCTLFVGALNWLLVPASIVEPLIALSIAAVAAQNLLRPGGSKHRVALVFVFGLLHGQGFAGVLSELRLARHDLLRSVLGFNLGVEAGQLVVALSMLGLLHVLPRRYRQVWLVIPASSISIAIAAYWVFERTLG